MAPSLAMHNTLILTVKVTVGANLHDAVRDGCLLAYSMGLSRIEFTANDEEFICYSNNRAIKRTVAGLYRAVVDVGANTGTSIVWEKITPITD